MNWQLVLQSNARVVLSSVIPHSLVVFTLQDGLHAHLQRHTGLRWGGDGWEWEATGSVSMELHLHQDPGPFASGLMKVTPRGWQNALGFESNSGHSWLHLKVFKCGPGHKTCRADQIKLYQLQVKVFVQRIVTRKQSTWWPMLACVYHTKRDSKSLRDSHMPANSAISQSHRGVTDTNAEYPL